MLDLEARNTARSTFIAILLVLTCIRCPKVLGTKSSGGCCITCCRLSVQPQLLRNVVIVKSSHVCVGKALRGSIAYYLKNFMGAILYFGSSALSSALLARVL